jgi:hypothetical protein
MALSSSDAGGGATAVHWAVSYGNCGAGMLFQDMSGDAGCLESISDAEAAGGVAAGPPLSLMSTGRVSGRWPR